MAGRFTLIGETRELGFRPDWRFREEVDRPSRLWRHALHYHAFLVHAAAGALRDPRHAEPYLRRAADLLDHWSRHVVLGEPWAWDTAWHPYSVSTRLLNAWMARLLLMEVKGAAAKELRRRLDGLGATSAEFVCHWLEHDLGGNHLLRNAAALVAAGHWFRGPKGRSWLQVGTDLLDRELRRQILSDGFHEERSPMYHALIVQDILLAMFLAPTGRRDVDPMENRLWRMWNALDRVVHPDHGIALLNDSTFGVTAELDDLRSLYDRLGLATPSMETHDLADAGYFTFREDNRYLIFDAGPLGPDHLPAHAHCDALAMEYSEGTRRIIVDTGVDRYEPGPERSFQRSTVAHSTLQVGNLEQGEPFSSFRLGRRPRVTGRRIDAMTVEGRHDGFGAIHRRRLQWDAHGFRWTDSVASPEPVPISIRVGLSPGCSVALRQTSAAIGLDSGERFEITGPEHGRLAVERGTYCPGFGKSLPRDVLVWRGVTAGDMGLRFRFRRRA